MLKKFPESYPYLNKNGASITKQDVDAAAARLLLILHNGEEKGLEISHALMYAMEHVQPGTSLGALAYSVVPLIFTWLNFDRKLATKEDREKAFVSLKETADTTLEQRLIDSISLDNIVSKEDRADIFEMTKVQRHRAIAKLKQKFKGLNPTTLDEKGPKDE